MSKTCGNCTHWDSAHSCAAPLPRWAALIINASQRHFIPAFTSAAHCPCWIAAQLPRIIEGRSEGHADVCAELRAIIDPQDKNHWNKDGLLHEVIRLLTAYKASLGHTDDVWLSKTQCQTCCYGGICRLRPDREIECKDWCAPDKPADVRAAVKETTP